jgi:hypothetical protein
LAWIYPFRCRLGSTVSDSDRPGPATRSLGPLRTGAHGPMQPPPSPSSPPPSLSLLRQRPLPLPALILPHLNHPACTPRRPAPHRAGPGRAGSGGEPGAARAAAAPDRRRRVAGRAQRRVPPAYRRGARRWPEGVLRHRRAQVDRSAQSGGWMGGWMERMGGWRGWMDGEDGWRERGSEGARERGSEGARERGTDGRTDGRMDGGE